jgi:large subunit ribosomal protein L9
VRQELQQLSEQLGAASCTIAAKANEEGHLFGSVGAKQIADVLAGEGFARITPEMIVLEEPIRQLGVFDVPVQLAADLKVACKVWVVQE